VCPLTALGVGQQAEVMRINSTQESRLARLSAFGLVPGSLVTLHQRDLAYVVLIGETEVALDTEVAREILVRVR
jgi:Fe2+ transport system protein FeoA